MQRVTILWPQARHRRLELEHHRGTVEIVQVDDGQALVARWSELPEAVPDCAVLDLTMPGVAQVLSFLHRARPGVCVIGLADGPGAAVEAMRLGFHDCLPMAASPEQLQAAIRAGLLHRGRFVPRPLLQRLIESAGEPVLELDRAVRQLLPGAGLRTWLLAANRLHPGGEPVALSDGNRAELQRGDRSRLDLPDREPLEAHPLASGICLLRSVGSGAPGLADRLVGLFLGQAAQLATAARSAEPCAHEDLTRFSDVARRLDHDIRNPLCALALNAHLLAMGLPADLDPRIAERVQAIQRSAERIKELMDQLTAAKRELRSSSPSPVA